MQVFTSVRKAAIALIAATAFLFASTECAIASTRAALPEPTPIVLFEQDLAFETPQGELTTEAALVPDLPARVPAQLGGGKLVLWMLALIGLAALVAVGLVVYAVYTLMNSDV